MLVRVMTRPECRNKTQNLGAQESEMTIEEVARTCHCAVGGDVTIQPEPPPGSPARRAPDISGTMRLPGYQARVPLHEGVRHTFEWIRAHVFTDASVSAA